MDLICKNCGEVFCIPSRREDTAKYCSYICMGEARKGICLNSGKTHFKKGSVPWNKGKHDYSTSKKGQEITEETRQKISASKKGKCLKGDHWAWKGAYAGYRALHIRLGKTENCMLCGSMGGKSRGCHWANISKNYADPNDYICLCPRCHKNFDLGKIDIYIGRSK